MDPEKGRIFPVAGSFFLLWDICSYSAFPYPTV